MITGLLTLSAAAAVYGLFGWAAVKHGADSRPFDGGRNL
jgi:hypothetical protein